MTHGPSARSALALLPVVGIPAFLAIANQTMVSVALPEIGAHLGQLRRLPWLVMGYMMALTVAGPLYGVLGDTYGRARMLQSALLVYIAGSLACAAAGDMTILALGRVVQGLGGGGLMALAQALIADAVPPRERGRAQGYIAMISVLASTSGPLLGGVMIETLGWRSLFLVTIPLALLAMLLLHRRRIPRGPARQTRFDFAGFFALLALVLGGTSAIELASEPGHMAWVIPGALVGLAGFVALFPTQRRAHNPLFPPDLFAIPAVTRAALMAAFHGAALVSLVTMVPLFHAILRADSALETAMSMLAMTATLGIAGFTTGNLVTATGRTAIYPSVSLLVAIAAIGFLAVKGSDLGRTPLMAIYLIIGLSIGTVMTVVNITIQQEAPAVHRGRAAGAITFFRSVGAVAGTSLSSSVLFLLAPVRSGTGSGALLTGATGVDPQTLDAWRTAFMAGFGTIACFVIGTWLMALTNPSRRID
ncbi:MAG: MFS transporter [Rhodobacteraceae bacterium]|jgi:MFS family permease|nr:MFS transporter [Paracoccaceae bacterium]